MYKNVEDKRLYDKTYNINNKEKIAKKSKDWYENNKERKLKAVRLATEKRNNRLREEEPSRYMCSLVKKKAKVRGLEWDICPDDFIVPSVCPILHIPLVFNRGRPESNSPSLDRIDNSKGYIKGNIRVISRKANALKADLSIEQVSRLLKYMKQELEE